MESYIEVAIRAVLVCVFAFYSSQIPNMVRAAGMFAVIFAVGAVGPEIYNQRPTTRRGCECQSQCKTSLTLHGHVDEYCKVDKNQCPGADWSITEGTHDWCVFPPDGGFESKSAAEKQQLLLSTTLGD